MARRARLLPSREWQAQPKPAIPSGPVALYWSVRKVVGIEQQEIRNVRKACNWHRLNPGRGVSFAGLHFRARLPDRRERRDDDLEAWRTAGLCDLRCAGRSGLRD